MSWSCVTVMLYALLINPRHACAAGVTVLGYRCGRKLALAALTNNGELLIFQQGGLWSLKS